MLFSDKMPFDQDAPPQDPELEQPQEPVAEEAVDPDETADVEEVAEILKEYRWAPGKPEDEFFGKIIQAEEDFFNLLNQLGLLQMYRVAYSTYYGLNGNNGEFESQSIKFAGEDDERVEYTVNEFRSFCDQIFNMTCKNRPAFQAQAINTDSRTTGQIEASDNIIKYYYEQVFGERKEKEVVAAEGRYGKSYTYIDWDEDGGPDVEIEEPYSDPTVGDMPPIKKKVKAGEFNISRLYMWNVVCDLFQSEHDGHLWRSLIQYKSKWEMIAKYPLYARVISEQTDQGDCAYASMFPGPRTAIDANSDKVIVRTFLHAPSAALPTGRKAVFVGSKLVADGPLPIDALPVIDFMSCELDGTAIGISDLWNLIPDQQMITQVMSDVATLVEAYGRPPLVVVEGSDLDIDALANGQKVLTIPSMDQMPQVVQFPQINEVALKVVELCRKFMQSKSGMNAISRGESDASVKSGTHAALYHAMAVENQSPRSGNLDLHRERVTNTILLYLKKFAKHPQLVAIAGEDERPYLQYLTQKDVAGIQRVVVKTANPLMRTQAGRLQIAELLRDWPGQPLKDPSEIIELIVSGQFKPMYSPTRAELMRIKRENEVLAAGPPMADVPTGDVDPMTGQPQMKKTVPTVPVYPTDNATKHIAKHLELLASPDTQNNPAKRDAVMAHIMDHVACARTGDPYLAELLGIPGPPPPPGMEAQEPDDGSASGKGPSDVDMQKASQVTAKPGSQPSVAEQDDSKSALGNIPRPAQPPGTSQLDQ